jgi:hypothetical protein
MGEGSRISYLVERDAGLLEILPNTLEQQETEEYHHVFH